MPQYIQDNLPTMDEQLARIDQKDIDAETAQLHLAREFARWGKYAKFSKDPKFKERCRNARLMLCKMMGRVGR